MAKNIQAIRGMKDCLPKETALWQRIEDTLKQVLGSYCYSEIRLPLVEQTSLFQRAIGEVTDVVGKEMYTFEDRNGESLTLRPEGTAGCVRAGIEHSLLRNQEQQRWWYIGQMFRHERPQKGRYRQFHQLGAEVFGLQGPDVDAELILLTARCWRELGINEHVTLQLNSIGSQEARKNYRKELVAFLEKHQNQLDEDCQRRMHSNPLRALDSKNPDVQLLLKDAPSLFDYLDGDSKEHFTKLCELLDHTGIKYTINERLVRGLDYYNRTVFEWVVTSRLGAAQSTLCAGGRYDGLVEQLGGQETPAVGFALGLERLVLLVQEVSPKFTAPPKIPEIDVYLISVGDGVRKTAMKLAETLRKDIPTLKLMTHHGTGDFKTQFSRADKLGARIALIMGKKENMAQQVKVKDLGNGEEETLAQSNVATRLASLLSKKEKDTVTTHTTKNDQLDTVRCFFIENGKALAVGVVLGISALVGWRYWQSHQSATMSETSSAYQQVKEALSTNQADGVAIAEAFAQNNKNNYGVFTALQLAHHFVEQHEFTKAEQSLIQAKHQTKDDNLLSLINLRLARLQLQQQRPDEALKTLDDITAEGWLAIAQDVRGDTLLSQGDTQGARDAYSTGIKLTTSQTLQELLRMKLNNLSS